MKRVIILMLALSIVWATRAQTMVDKTLPVQKGQNILLHFDYPELIRVTTWDKNEVSVHASVSINSGESDGAFELSTSTDGGTVSVRNHIRDMKNLPKRTTIIDGGQKITFRTHADYTKYQQETGRSSFEMVSMGVDMEIIVDIKVPKGATTRVESVYGMVEVKSFDGPLAVEATYGGVDAALLEKSIGLVEAETNFGEIYTNFDTRFTGGSGEKNFHLAVSAKPGSGPHYAFESKYGNVYLRKAVN
ncbi:hypothetical protein WBG78_11330 [Chryseolinea sp. T2]|uniref:hypothetical protein n=1 Tax=Chryseolinea sp. T2 TaxID=3129255 RepID=UPI00307693BD